MTGLCFQHRRPVKPKKVSTKERSDDVFSRLMKKADAVREQLIPATVAEMSGTSGKATFRDDYSHLIKNFGEPHDTDIDEIGPGRFKTKVQWAFKYTPTGMIFTIYDWKQYATPKEKIMDWYIGGNADIDTGVIATVLGLLQYPTRI